MPLLGQAAIAMWWDMTPDMRSEFEDWHSHEHFPERMSIPGFHRGSRWMSNEGRDGFFVLYELESYETLVSPAYLTRLNAPTPWSRKMMPHHRNMVRSQCRVLDSAGGGIASFMLTLQFSLTPDLSSQFAAKLRAYLGSGSLASGLTGIHLLLTDTPDAPATVEQEIRGGDRTADRILLVSGYERGAVSSALDDLSRLTKLTGNAEPALYRLSLSATPADFRQ